ncbi:MAG: TolC family protein [Blastocatellia bacterium]|nr:TolC family protein [Blastocatellia bacterium]
MKRLHLLSAGQVCACLLSLFWVPVPVAAQLVPTDPQLQSNQSLSIPRKLTLEQAETLLLQRNLTVAGSKYQIEVNQAARLLAAYKPNPVLTVGAEQLNLAAPHVFYQTDSNLAAQGTYTLRVDKIIERGGKRELRTQQADALVEAAKAQMRDTCRTQLFQLRQAFGTAILARENLQLAVETDRQYEQTERLTSARVENGDLSPAELYRVRTGRLQYQQAVLQAETAYNQATREVLNLLGANPGEVENNPETASRLENGATLQPVALRPNVQTLPELLRNSTLEIVGRLNDQPLSLDRGKLVETALAERPDVQVARHNLEAAEKSWKLAQAQRTRDISVGVEYQRVGSDHAVGVVTQIPLFVYNNHNVEISQAESQYRMAQTALKLAENQAVTDVEKAWQTFQAAQKTLQLYNSDNLTQVEKLREIAAFSYKEGASSLFELLDAQRAANQAATAYNQARADYQLSLWMLEQATGKPLSQKD